MTEPPSVVEPATTSALGPWRELRSGVYVAVAEPESVNLGLIVGSQQALLVDTGSTPGQGRVLRASLTAVTELLTDSVVVTHWHYDHAFGLAAFADIPRIAHESVHLRSSSAEAAAEAKRLGLDPEGSAEPNVEIAVVTAFDLGERRVEIAHLGRGHTDGDLVVVVPTPMCCLPGSCWNPLGHRRSAPIGSRRMASHLGCGDRADDGDDARGSGPR